MQGLHESHRGKNVHRNVYKFMNFEIKPVPFSGPSDTFFFRIPIEGEEFQTTPHVEEAMHSRNCSIGQHFGQKVGKISENLKNQIIV